MTWKLGPYRVDDKPFAAGATAEVFAARKGRTGERVAVKVLPLRSLRERAEAEADVASIDHPRLLSVRDRVVDERRGVIGLVMDLVSEGDLRAALRGSNAPTPIEMVQVADDVLAGLEALHGVGLVHRDIKPENVMLERVDGQLRARLGDLGIARPADRTRSTGSVLGTDLYIAPEVHGGAAASPSADLWAVGYVLYEGLFGAPPHADASTTYQAIGRLQTEGPDRPPKVPEPIWAVVAALLAPRPAERPAGARAARALLDSARPAAEAASAAMTVDESPVDAVRRPGRRRTAPTARRSNALERRTPSYERRPGVARGAAAVAAVALIAGGVAWVGGGERLRWSDGETPSLAAIRSVTPMPPESDEVVPTQYRWRLHNGVLTGRLSVSNPSDVTTQETAIPELFPRGAVRRGGLPLVDYDGPVERQPDGSMLVRFAVPPLAPGAHHVVSFRLALADEPDDRAALAKLVRERQASITRHALALSDAPTLAAVIVDLSASSLAVGDRAVVSIRGLTPTGEAAPAELLKDARIDVVGSGGVVRLDNVALVALTPGDVVVRAVVGDLHADAPLTVVAQTPTKPKRTNTTRTSIVVEEAPAPPPEDVIL